MKKIIQFIIIGAACVASREQTATEPSTNSTEIAELKAKIAALEQQVEVLTAELKASRSSQQQQQSTSRAFVSHEWRRTSNGGWFLNPLAAAQPESRPPSDAKVASIVRNAPGRVVGISVAPPRRGVPTFARVHPDGSVSYALAPARNN
jgi:outer membrane murein-binding lipoprotein Lpp